MRGAQGWVAAACGGALALRTHSVAPHAPPPPPRLLTRRPTQASSRLRSGTRSTARACGWCVPWRAAEKQPSGGSCLVRALADRCFSGAQGTYDTAEEAARVYDAAARHLRGASAVCNYPHGAFARRGLQRASQSPDSLPAPALCSPPRRNRERLPGLPAAADARPGRRREEGQAGRGHGGAGAWTLALTAATLQLCNPHAERPSDSFPSPVCRRRMGPRLRHPGRLWTQRRPPARRPGA